ncbi:hypothetical protein IHE44_0009198, partial [Lamprotornis superbus]
REKQVWELARDARHAHLPASPAEITRPDCPSLPTQLCHAAKRSCIPDTRAEKTLPCASFHLVCEGDRAAPDERMLLVKLTTIVFQKCCEEKVKTKLNRCLSILVFDKHILRILHPIGTTIYLPPKVKALLSTEEWAEVPWLRILGTQVFSTPVLEVHFRGFEMAMLSPHPIHMEMRSPEGGKKP